jgi:NADPH-dependent curcumin reductase CurA
VGGAAADLNGKTEIVSAPRIANDIYYKGASVRGFMNGLLTAHWPEARAKLFAMYAQGRIKVRIDEPCFTGLEGIYDGVERLLSGASTGKVMVKLA